MNVNLGTQIAMELMSKMVYGVQYLGNFLDTNITDITLYVMRWSGENPGGVL